MKILINIHACHYNIGIIRGNAIELHHLQMFISPLKSKTGLRSEQMKPFGSSLFPNFADFATPESERRPPNQRWPMLSTQGDVYGCPAQSDPVTAFM